MNAAHSTNSGSRGPNDGPAKGAAGHASTFLLSVLGIDGSGKTRMLQELQQRNVLPGADYVRVERYHCENLLRRYVIREGDELDFVDGAFARTRPFATCLDFLETYDKRILPRLGQAPFIVVERYCLSAAAYFAAMGHREWMYSWLGGVRPADLTIYLKVDLDTVLSRYERRGGRDTDEVPELMRRHAQAIEQVVAETSWPIVTIDNTQPFELAFHQLCGHVSAAVAAHSARGWPLNTP